MYLPRDRRSAAAELFGRGMSRAAVARELGVSRATTTRWFRRWQSGGRRAVLLRGRPGPGPRLGTREVEQLRGHLLGSPAAVGFPLRAWSLAAIAAHIRRAFGIAFHPRHVPRVLRRGGWVVLPVGRLAQHAFCVVPAEDPDGNRVLLHIAPTRSAPGGGEPRGRNPES